MKPEFILKADLLDIIFENRNKEYGAYELRSHYPGRLAKSLVIIFSVTASLALLGFWRNSFPGVNSGRAVLPVIGPNELVPVDLHPKTQQVSPPRRKAPAAQDMVPHISRNVDTTTMRQVGDIPDDQTGDPKGNGTKEQSGPALAGGDSGINNPAPVTESPAENNAPLIIAEEMPQFPGGLPALQRFLSRNLKTPDSRLEPGPNSRVLVRFVVDRDGSITGLVVEQSGGADCDREVLRVMQKMPAWKPGKQNGRNVAVYFKIPVVFQAADEN